MAMKRLRPSSSGGLSRTASRTFFLRPSFVPFRYGCSSYSTTPPPAQNEGAPTLDDVPDEWDVEYLNKFPVAYPTPEQFARLVKAPLELPGRAGELATELFEAASVVDAIDKIGTDLAGWIEFIQEDPEAAEAINDKLVPKTDQRKVLEGIFPTAHPLLRKFVARAIENGELNRLEKIAESYKNLVRAHNKEVDVKLVFAKLPPPEKVEVLKQRLTFHHLPKGSRPIWQVAENPELISGYVFTTPEATVDTSELNKQKEIQDALTHIWARVNKEGRKFFLEPLGQKISLQKPDDLQKLAAVLDEQHKKVVEAAENHYRTNYVDWA